MKFQQCVSFLLVAVAVCTNHSVFRNKRGAKKSQDTSARLAVANSTAVAAVELEHGDNECLSWTGGVCSANVCSRSHGPAVCQEMYCMCPPGHCTTADGLCVTARNTLVARGVQFRNARYSDEVIKVVCVGVVEDRFDILEMAKAEGGDSLYMFITSVGKCAVKLDEEVDMFTGPTGDYMIVGVQLKNVDSPTAPRLFALRVSEAPPYADDPRSGHLDAEDVPSTVVLEVAAAEKWGYHSLVHWSGLHTGVHNGETQHGGAGTAAFWIVDPQWPGHVPPYQGPPCTWDCGEYGSGPYTTKEDRFVGPRYILLLSIIGLVFLCLFGCCYLYAMYATGMCYRDGCLKRDGPP